MLESQYCGSLTEETVGGFAQKVEKIEQICSSRYNLKGGRGNYKLDDVSQ